MTQVLTVRLVDDLDGSSADETVEFAIDGKQYEIDLTSAHASTLRGVLADYAAAARKHSTGLRRGRRRAEGTTARPTAPVNREQNQAIRAWARKQGISVSNRGRIPQNVLDAFQKQA